LLRIVATISHILKFSGVRLFEMPYSLGVQEMNVIVPKGSGAGEGGNQT
jgi:hypothetical protein